jgi:hypothetical protein
MGKDHDKEMTSDKVYDKLEDMDNKLERIKSDTHNLNRIASLSNAPLIIQELKKIVGRSEIRAAILHLTKDETNARELASKLGINPSNLATFVKPFLGNRGYITATKKGREIYFQRSELIDLVGFESIDEFAALLKSWEEKRGQPVVSTNATSEGTNAD